MYNLFRLGSCCDTWLYSDTDSVYGMGWDDTKVNSYNNECKKALKKAGYGAVNHNKRDYWLGVAEHEGNKDTYNEFRTAGAKRYCGRNTEDGKLHITVAGVPKAGAEALHDNINNFTSGMIFPGSTTGKKTHFYFHTEEIYIDEKGNVTGDSVDLQPCDYLLKSENDIDWERILYEEITIQNYEIL